MQEGSVKERLRDHGRVAQLRKHGREHAETHAKLAIFFLALGCWLLDAGCSGLITWHEASQDESGDMALLVGMFSLYCGLKVKRQRHHILLAVNASILAWLFGSAFAFTPFALVVALAVLKPRQQENDDEQGNGRFTPAFDATPTWHFWWDEFVHLLSQGTVFSIVISVANFVRCVCLVSQSWGETPVSRWTNELLGVLSKEVCQNDGCDFGTRDMARVAGSGAIVLYALLKLNSLRSIFSDMLEPLKTLLSELLHHAGADEAHMAWENAAFNDLLNVSLNVLMPPSYPDNFELRRGCDRCSNERNVFEWLTLLEAPIEHFLPGQSIATNAIQAAARCTTPELSFLYTLSDKDLAQINTLLLNQISSRCSAQGSLEYAVGACSAKETFWFGVTCEVGRGVAQAKLRVFVASEATLEFIRGRLCEYKEKAQALRRSSHDGTNDHVQAFLDFCRRKEQLLDGNEDSDVHLGTLTCDRARERAREHKKELFEPEEPWWMFPSTPGKTALSGWKRWQTLLEMAMLYSELNESNKDRGSGVLQRIHLVLPGLLQSIS